MKRRNLLLLLLLFSNPLDIRVPRQSGMAPFTLQAHIFSRDPEAETIQIELESDSVYFSKTHNQEFLIQYRKERLGPGTYKLTVTVTGGKENKVLHKKVVEIKVSGGGNDADI